MAVATMAVAAKKVRGHAIVEHQPHFDDPSHRSQRREHLCVQLNRIRSRIAEATIGRFRDAIQLRPYVARRKA
ncbi:hypothetical protein [Sphingomonas sp.]|uniref:hypothetical protein n=1 Tax=Sphingomonas sp. TaxID=28214 RepID=UPI000DB07A6A|nr:hypothetical protein [Sphingomonas sp.]PZU06414.1 MAG: hypothetical protein DI605_19150 [Sphingomonas sp.]